METPKDEVQAQHYVCLAQDIKEFMESTYETVKALRDVGHAQQYELGQFREAITRCHTYFTAIDRQLDNLNKRVQMLELRMAKEEDGGHA